MVESNKGQTMQLLKFSNLAQRVLHRYAFTFSNFIPFESNEVSQDAQRAFYERIGAIVRGIAEKPSILGLSEEHPDQWLGAHELLNRHPALYKVRNECQKAFNDLSGFLFTLGLHGECHNGRLIVRQSDLPKLTAKTLGIFQRCLTHFGLIVEKCENTMEVEFPQCPDALSAWRCLAEKCSKYTQSRQAIRFALWLHHDDYTYFLRRINILLGLDGQIFDYISAKYQEKGYGIQFDIDEYRTNCEFAKEVGGLRIEYATLWPTVRFVNKNSIGIKAALEHANEFDDEIVNQLIRFCKRCNNCMVCTKSGKNRQFTVMVCHDGTESRLCPEFVQME